MSELVRYPNGIRTYYVDRLGHVYGPDKKKKGVHLTDKGYAECYMDRKYVTKKIK